MGNNSISKPTIDILLQKDLPAFGLSCSSGKDTLSLQSLLVRKWMIDQITINGKKEEPSDFEIEFSIDGTYYLIEDDESEEGTWELDESTMTIVFNSGTEDEFVWQIITLDEKKLLVKETYGKITALYTLIPWVDWKDLILE
jgi:hypothetical protein